MLRAGFFTDAARITGLLAKKELIAIFFTVWVNHQSLGRTIDRAKGTARALFLIDADYPMILWQKPL